MRNILIVIQVAVVIFLARLCSPETANITSNRRDDNSELQAKAVSNYENKNSRSAMIPVRRSVENSPELIQFLRETADARMMDVEEGRLATEQGSTKAIQAYGALMVKDQAGMLNEIKSIAKTRNIALDQRISDKKLDGLIDIKNLKGRHFDKKFIRMMKIDHRRDIRQLKKAVKSDDPEVKRIGNKYLPLVKSHLDKLKQL